MMLLMMMMMMMMMMVVMMVVLCVKEFVYDRFVNDAKFFKAGLELRQSVMAFGALCPGKRYALLQLKWFLLTMLSRFELRYKPSSSLPEYDMRCHGHEVVPPLSDVDVEYRRRLKWKYRRLQLTATPTH